MQLSQDLSAAVARALMPESQIAMQPAASNPSDKEPEGSRSVLPNALARFRAEREQEERERAALETALARFGVTLNDVMVARELRFTIEDAMLPGSAQPEAAAVATEPIPQEANHGDSVD